MNREIKFRMWRDDRMQSVHTMYTTVSDDWVKPIEPQNFAATEGEVLMQYTGLKDKNGKDIYEGDIVKIPDDYDQYGFLAGETRCIHFTAGGFRLTPLDPTARGQWLEDGDDCTVIGNIYEHPHLLTPTQQSPSPKK